MFKNLRQQMIVLCLARYVTLIGNEGKPSLRSSFVGTSVFGPKLLSSVGIDVATTEPIATTEN
jgi:hypothetical protein